MLAGKQKKFEEFQINIPEAICMGGVRSRSNAFINKAAQYILGTRNSSKSISSFVDIRFKIVKYNQQTKSTINTLFRINLLFLIEVKSLSCLN